MVSMLCDVRNGNSRAPSSSELCAAACTAATACQSVHAAAAAVQVPRVRYDAIHKRLVEDNSRPATLQAPPEVRRHIISQPNWCIYKNCTVLDRPATLQAPPAVRTLQIVTQIHSRACCKRASTLV
jgi:hypothetical protein